MTSTLVDSLVVCLKGFLEPFLAEPPRKQANGVAGISLRKDVDVHCRPFYCPAEFQENEAEGFGHVLGYPYLSSEVAC